MKYILWSILGIVIVAVIFLVYSDAQAKKFAEAERRRKPITTPATQDIPAKNWVNSLTGLIYGTKDIIETLRKDRRLTEGEKAQIRLAQQQGMTQEEALALL